MGNGMILNVVYEYCTCFANVNDCFDSGTFSGIKPVLVGHLRDAFLQAIEAHDLTQAKFAELAGVSRSNITYFISGGAPRDELFRSIFTLWNNEATAAHLFRAHLRDEAERAGVDPANVGVGAYSTADLLAIEDDLHALRRLLIADPEVRPFIRKMAVDFKAAARNTVTFPHADEDRFSVAEDPSAYGKKAGEPKPVKTGKTRAKKR